MAAPTVSSTSTSSSLSARIADAVATWSSSQIDIVMLAAEQVDSPEWVIAGSPTPAHHLAALADVEPCTASERQSRWP